MVKNKLIYPGVHGYVNDYNPHVDPSVLDEHATAAFRHFHTLIRGYLKYVFYCYYNSLQHSLIFNLVLIQLLIRNSIINAIENLLKLW